MAPGLTAAASQQTAAPKAKAPKGKAKAAAARKNPRQPHDPPPKLTASFVMGVQQRPITRAMATRRQPKGRLLFAALVREAESAATATAAATAAAAEAAEAEASLRTVAVAAASAASGTQPKIASITSSIPNGPPNGKKPKGPSVAVAVSRACGAVSRAVSARTVVQETEMAAQRAAIAHARVERYRGAWQGAIENCGVTGSWKDSGGKRQLGSRVPVGHKLRQLCRACGVQMSDEAFGLAFESLGGIGAMCDVDAFLRFVSEHDTTADAAMHNDRYARDAAASAAAASHGSPGSRSSSSFKGGGGSSSSELSPKGLLRAARRSLPRASPPSGGGGASGRQRSRSRAGPATIDWAEFRSMVSGNKASEAPGEEALSKEAVWALFLKCGGCKETGKLDRKAFLQAAAVDEQRRTKPRKAQAGDVVRV